MLLWLDIHIYHDFFTGAGTIIWLLFSVPISHGYSIATMTHWVYVSGQEGAAVLLPDFALKWQQNQVTRQPHLRDLTQIPLTQFHSSITQLQKPNWWVRGWPKVACLFQTQVILCHMLAGCNNCTLLYSGHRTLYHTLKDMKYAW